MKKILFIIIILLLLSINCYAKDQNIYVANTAYKNATDNIVKTSADFLEKIYSKLSKIVKLGWEEDEDVLKAMNDNEKAMNLFKETTKQKSNGSMFIEETEEIDSEMPIPSYDKEILLFELILAEGMMFEEKGEYNRAEDNYLAAARFIMHISQEKIRVLVSELIGFILFDKAYPSFARSLTSNNFSKEYYEKLYQYLHIITNNQGFLESSFEIELLFMKHASAQLKEAVINNVEEVFKAEGRQLTQEEVGEFFKIFFERQSEIYDDHFATLIICAKQNNTDLAKKKINDIRQLHHPLQMMARFIKKLLIDRRTIFQIKAELMAEEFIYWSIADFTTAISRFHIFYNKSNLLTAALAIKLYETNNGILPDKLEQLIPGYLEKVSQDTYNKFREISYIKGKKGFKVYSFGPDRKDDKADKILDEDKFYKDNSYNGGIVFSMQ